MGNLCNTLQKFSSYDRASLHYVHLFDVYLMALHTYMRCVRTYVSTYKPHHDRALSEAAFEAGQHQSQHNFISNVALNQFVPGSYSSLYYYQLVTLTSFIYFLQEGDLLYIRKYRSKEICLCLFQTIIDVDYQRSKAIIVDLCSFYF